MKTKIILSAIVMIAFCAVFINVDYAHAWPWDKKESTKTAQTSSEKDLTGAPDQTKNIQVPKFTLPKMPLVEIPKIEFPQQPQEPGAVKPPAHNVAADKAKAPMPAAAEAAKPINVRMETVSGELVSAKKKDENTVIITVKKADGTEFTSEGDARLEITRTFPILELAPGEKITTHCIINEDKKESRAVHITADIARPPAGTAQK